MPIALSCPCGKNLKVQDNLAGRRVKCPTCGEILEVPPATAQEEEIVFHEIASSPRPEPPAMPPPVAPPPDAPRPDSKQNSTTIGGGSASVLLGNLLVPSFFGRSALTLANGRVIEISSRLIGTRHAELLVRKVDSAEIVAAGNPLLLVFGLLLVGVYGIGLILLLIFAFKKHRYLVIRSSSNAVAIRLNGPEARYAEFLEAVLAAAEATRD